MLCERASVPVCVERGASFNLLYFHVSSKVRHVSEKKVSRPTNKWARVQRLSAGFRTERRARGRAASIHCLTLLVVAHEKHAGLDQRAEAAWAGLQAGARAVASSTRRLPLF